MAVRLRVALSPSIKRRLSKAGRYNVNQSRGYTTVGNKTARFLNRLGITGQLAFNNEGYISVNSSRIPLSVRNRLGLRSARATNLPLHRIAYVIESGRRIPKARSKKFYDQFVPDHKNAKRFVNTLSNLEVVTQRENISRITKASRQLANRRRSETVQVRTRGAFKTAGAQGADTRRKLYGAAGERKFRLEGAKTTKAKYGTDYFKKLGKQGADTVAKKYTKAELSARNKASYQKRSSASIKKTTEAAKKAVAAILKKNPNFYKDRAAKIAANRKRNGTYGKKK